MKSPGSDPFRKLTSVEEIRYTLADSPQGRVLVACSDKGVVAILTGENRDELETDLMERFHKAELVRDDRGCRDVLEAVLFYFENPAGKLGVALDLRGTPFQKKVWEAVRRVPMGQTSTYSQIAEAVGAPKAVRAVGSSCTRSPMAMVIPCHRVLHKDGSMSGGDFWSNERQRLLLEREAAAVKANAKTKG